MIKNHELLLFITYPAALEIMVFLIAFSGRKITQNISFERFVILLIN
jgi:hypothetical protein